MDAEDEDAVALALTSGIEDPGAGIDPSGGEVDVPLCVDEMAVESDGAYTGVFYQHFLVGAVFWIYDGEEPSFCYPCALVACFCEWRRALPRWVAMREMNGSSSDASS